MIKVGVVKEIIQNEERVSLVPSSVKKLSKQFKVFIEKDAGISAGFSNIDYKDAGATIISTSSALLKEVDIICKVRPPTLTNKKHEIEKYKENSILFAVLDPLKHEKNLTLFAKKMLTSFALEYIPRITITQNMDLLSSMQTVSGYKAVLLASQYYQRFFPMLVTAAGTITPAKVLILGGGVAGLQALATAKRLGAVVEVFDVRPDVKEQVESLGGKFIEMPISKDNQDEHGYAKEMTKEFIEQELQLIESHLVQSNICITTAQVFGRKAPVLIKKLMVQKMSPGSVIIDLAVEQGGNCELSKADKIIKTINDVTIIAPTNILSLLAHDASKMISKNIENLLIYMFPLKNKIKIDLTDPIVTRTMISHNGALVSDFVRKLLPKKFLTEIDLVAESSKNSLILKKSSSKKSKRKPNKMEKK